MKQKMQKFWQNVSLRNKWFYSIALTIVGVYAVVCIIIYAALFAWLSENEKNNATRTVDDLQGYFASQSSRVTVNDLQQQQGLMQAILKQDQTVRLYTLDGVELLQINDASSKVELRQTTARTIIEQTVDGTDTFVVQDVIQVGYSPIIIQLVHPLTSFQAMMQYILTTMLILGIGALLLSGIISYMLAARFMRPLAELRNSMLQVKEHGVSASTLTADYGHDELGDVLKIYTEMLQQLEQSFQRQQQFVFDASHELRTPIQAIEGNLSLIKRWGKHDPEVLDESIDISLEEIVRMKKLMEELLLLARQQKTDTSQSVNVVPLLHTLATDYDVNIVINVQQDILEAIISEQAFTQIIRNFIENSIRYCDKQPIITITAQVQDDIVITFADNGIGIAEEQLPYIFDRFYKVDDARLHVEGSTGLGLSIVKMLVEKYSGIVEVSSIIGEGTIFTLHLPRNK